MDELFSARWHIESRWVKNEQNFYFITNNTILKQHTTQQLQCLIIGEMIWIIVDNERRFEFRKFVEFFILMKKASTYIHFKDDKRSLDEKFFSKKKIHETLFDSIETGFSLVCAGCMR